MSVPCRNAIKNLHRYVAAESLEDLERRFGVPRIIKLAGNENMLGCSPLAQKAIRETAGQLYRYPDISCNRIRDKVAERLNVPKESLVFGNGLFEVLSLIAQCYLEPGTESVFSAKSFGWYKTMTQKMGAALVEVPQTEDYRTDLDGMLDRVTPRTRVVWLCNPNNPTGTIFAKEQFELFLQKLPKDVLAVLDEAYCDFADAGVLPDSLALQKKHDNLVVLRTFSKVYGLAGLRIGYGIASPEIVHVLEQIRPSSSVNRTAQAAACACLDDEDFRNVSIENNFQGKKLYQSRLEKLGLGFLPTQSNFIMVNTGIDSASLVKEYLEKGFLLRGGDEFGMPGWLRITIGTPEQNERVLDILEDILKRWGGKVPR